VRNTVHPSFAKTTLRKAQITTRSLHIVFHLQAGKRDRLRGLQASPKSLKPPIKPKQIERWTPRGKLQEIRDKRTSVVDLIDLTLHPPSSASTREAPEHRRRTQRTTRTCTAMEAIPKDEIQSHGSEKTRPNLSEDFKREISPENPRRSKIHLAEAATPTSARGRQGVAAQTPSPPTRCKRNGRIEAASKS